MINKNKIFKNETEQEKKMNQKRANRYKQQRYHEIIDGKLVVHPVYSFNHKSFAQVCDWLVRINSTNVYEYNQPADSKYRPPQFLGRKSHPWRARKSQPWYGSYHLKHVCETAIGSYVSNCDLKDAAIELGFKIRLHKFDGTNLRDFTHPNFDIKLEEKSRMELLKDKVTRMEELLDSMDAENFSQEQFQAEIETINKFAYDYCNIEDSNVIYNFRDELETHPDLLTLASCYDQQDFEEKIRTLSYLKTKY